MIPELFRWHVFPWHIPALPPAKRIPTVPLPQVELLSISTSSASTYIPIPLSLQVLPVTPPAAPSAKWIPTSPLLRQVVLWISTVASAATVMPRNPFPENSESSIVPSLSQITPWRELSLAVQRRM